MAIFLLGAACSLPPVANWPAAAPTNASRAEYGTASWYGPGFHRNRTSNGEIYDQYAMTAAHQTLPLGSTVMVTNLENGRSVELRINDRGPFVEGRIIDLSYSAARELELVGSGTGPVRVERIDDGIEAGSRVLYAAQAASFQDGSRAFALKDRLGSEFDDAYVSAFRTEQTFYYRVRVGPYATREKAAERVRQLARRGLRPIIVEEVAP